MRSHISEDLEKIYRLVQERSQKVTGRERPRRPNFGLAVIGLVVAFVGLGAIFLWTSYHHPILVVLAMVCIFIGLVLVAAGAGLEWFPMMGVEKWRTSRRDLTKGC